MYIQVKKPEQVFEILELEENTLYEVRVQWNSQNPEHKAFLFTGFKMGNYCLIYNNNYDCPTPLMQAYKLKIIKKLAKID